MRKIISILILTFLGSAFCFASPKWIIDLEKVFPSEKFIRAIGEAGSETAAKKAAVSAVAEYFNQEISIQTFVDQSIHKDDSDYQEKADISQKVVSSSGASLFAVEYTSCFYDKRSQKYFVCAYLKRSTAWKSISQKADVAKVAYKETVREADGLSEPLSKIIMLNKAKKIFKDFFKLYKTALVIYPNRCDSMTSFAKKASADFAQLNPLKNQAAITIKATGDKRNRIQTKVASILSSNDLLVTTQNGSYTLTANISWNESEFNGVYSSYPQIQIIITNGSKTIASYSGQCEKTAAYNYNTMNKSAIFSLEELLDEHFFSECFE
ncbi:MAG: LPP20 family lipoprotein [Treponema sp.]|nr:LPP20 family lipoprotein [Treponema sp.]